MPLEMLVYRPIMAWARVKGTWRFTRGDKALAQVRAQRPGGRRHETRGGADEGGAAAARAVGGRGASPCLVSLDADAARPRALGRDRRRARARARRAVRVLARRRRAPRGGRRRSYGEWDAARAMLSALPDGLLLVAEGGSAPSTAGSATSSASSGRSCSAPRRRSRSGRRSTGTRSTAWHAELDAARRARRRAHVPAPERRSHPRSRRRARRLDRRRARRASSSPFATSRRATGVSGGWPSSRRGTPRPGLLDRREFEERLGEAVRRADGGGTNVTVVVAELGVAAGRGRRLPPARSAAGGRALASSGSRAGDDLARTRDAELAWILPETDADGGVEAVERWRADLGDVAGVQLTAGVCDLRRPATRSRCSPSPTGRSRPPAAAARGDRRDRSAAVDPPASDDRLHA